MNWRGEGGVEMKPKDGQPCVFFDRDGVVNYPPPPGQRYVTRAEDFHLLPGFVEALRVALQRGYHAVIITNQSGLERGHLTPTDLQQIHDKLLLLLRGQGLDLHDILVCPSADDAHPDRKPNPGLILTAARRHGLDLTRSWLVGDFERDIVAGRRAGVGHTLKVKAAPGATQADHQLASMVEVAQWLEQHLPVVFPKD